jgi:hypothetical protein
MSSTKSIFTAYTTNINTCGLNAKKNKRPLLGGHSPLRKDANFPAHQSHAENQLPPSRKSFRPSPLPQISPSTPSSTHVTHLIGRRRHQHARIFLCLAHYCPLYVTSEDKPVLASWLPWLGECLLSPGTMVK